MNKTFASIWLILTCLSLPQASLAAPEPETASLSEIESAAANFKGQIQQAEMLYDKKGNEKPPTEPLFKEYGNRTFTAFERHPELVASLKKLNPKFDPHTMQTSDLSSIATVDGKTFLILKGCFPHNCGGTNQVVAVELSTKKVYLLQPTNLGPDTEPSGKFYWFGNPDSSIKGAMAKASL